MGDEASKLPVRREASAAYGYHTPQRHYGGYSTGVGLPTAVSPVSLAFSSTPVRRSRNVIIFDWDDTLLCSSALRLGGPASDLLMQIEAASESLLLTAMSLGETLIITNGTESWVPESSARFLPGLVKTLMHVPTISARSRHEHRHPEDPFAWKREAFTELLSDTSSEVSTPCSPASLLSGSDASDIHLIVIGDSSYEIEAARSTLRLPSAPATVKTIKFKEVPTAHELLGQMRRCTQELSRVVSEQGHSSWGLSARPLPAHMASLRACSSAWDLVLEKAPDHVSQMIPSFLLPPPTRAAAVGRPLWSSIPGLEQPRDVYGNYDSYGYYSRTLATGSLLPAPVSAASQMPLQGATDTLYLSSATASGPPRCPWVH